MNSKPVRHVVVHYHIFKNAGSTVDSMLERQFPGRWRNFDKAAAASYIRPAEFGEFIQAHPELAAVSSHQAVLPLPEIEGVALTPVLFLRHPLDRVRSVYDFERRQGQMTGPVSKGAEHAARLSFADYLQWRFAAGRNGVVHNFQTVRLIHHPRFSRQALRDSDFERAWTCLRQLPFFGLVEQFDAGVALLCSVLCRRGIHFGTDYIVRNQSKREEKLNERLDRIRHELGPVVWQELVDRNRHDLHLYELAEREFTARQQSASAPRPAT